MIILYLINLESLLYFFTSLISDIYNTYNIDEEKLEIENVCIQLPICNENTYEKIIKSSTEIDWPKEKLYIQILDDSKDLDIVKNIKKLIKFYKLKEFNIEYFSRKNKPEGYKAGNLNNGILELNEKYKYIAIFDADFEIPKQFIKKTIIYFQMGKKISFVQAKWGYINWNQNFLTMYQDIHQNAHFQLSQQPRYFLKWYIQFNGSAAIWSRECLKEVNTRNIELKNKNWTWNHDTLVEDMSASLCAYSLGYKYIYINDIICQSLLPDTVDAYLKQQYRWNCGPIQEFIKFLFYKDIKISIKLMVTWFFIKYISCLSYTYLLMFKLPEFLLKHDYVNVFSSILPLLIMFYGQPLSKIKFIPIFIWLSIPIYTHYSISIIEGLLYLPETNVWHVTNDKTNIKKSSHKNKLIICAFCLIIMSYIYSNIYYFLLSISYVHLILLS